MTQQPHDVPETDRPLPDYTIPDAARPSMFNPPHYRHGTTPAAPEQPRKRRRFLRFIVFALIGLTLFVLGFAAGSSGSSKPTAAPPTQTVTAPAPAPSTQTVTAPAAPPQTVTAAPAGPAAAFGDGVLVVGTDIQAGTYAAPNPNGRCYFARLKGTSGEFDDILANGNPSGPVTVTIKSTDKAFESARCGGWVKK